MTQQTDKSNKNVVYSGKDPVVFCPQDRRKVLVDGLDVRLQEIMQQGADELEGEIIELAILPDHVHRLCEVAPQCGVHTLVKRGKGLSSFLLRKQFPTLKSRIPTLWTNSYFISTVGGAPLAVMKQYIENQKDA
jgi:putative transposase